MFAKIEQRRSTLPSRGISGSNATLSSSKCWYKTSRMCIVCIFIGTLLVVSIVSQSQSSLFLFCNKSMIQQVMTETEAARRITTADTTQAALQLRADTDKIHSTIDGKESSYQLAYDESYGFFDDISTEHWQLMQKRVRGNSLFYNPTNPNDGVDNIPLWMLNNIDPMFTCQHLRRMGGKGDGPKWVCDPHRLVSKQRSDCLIYSVGSSGDYRFEDSIVDLVASYNNGTNTNCQMHVFDPNPAYERPNDQLAKNIHYHPWGLISSYDPTLNNQFGNFQFKSFLETQQLLGHVGRRIDIFKIDCEGCEFGSYKDWINANTIQQILIEVHPNMIPLLNWINITVGQFFTDLYEHGYVPFSKEANTHPMALPANTFFEFGFIRLKHSFFHGQPN